MTRGARHAGVTVVGLAAAILVNGALLAAAPPTTTTTVHPVAPPLTHIPAMAERTLGLDIRIRSQRGLILPLTKVIDAVGDPEQRAALALLHAPGADETRESVARARARAQALRIAVERDAVALAEALGPARVGAIIAAREALAATHGEERAWRAAGERLER